MEYFDLLVKEGLLSQATILPSDCEFLIGEMGKIEQDERTREFAL